MKTHDTLHHYRTPPHTQHSQCRLRIYSHLRGHTIILTEIAENQGMSITNAAEELATQLCRAYSLDPSRTTWIEHYTSHSYRERRDPNETFDLITFTWDDTTHSPTAQHPNWRRLAIEEVEVMTDEDIEAITLELPV